VREAAGRDVTSVVVTGPRTVRRQPPEVLVDRLRGARLGEARRIGKFLLVPLDDGADTLVIHLRMSGQLLLTVPEWPLAKHTHAVLGLSDGRELRFVDPRTFGELFVAAAPVAALAHLGPDPLSPRWSAAVLGRGLTGRTGRLKLLLMDQRFVAGIGNIYSDEALFEARLRFDRPAGSLSVEEVGRLHRAVRRTLREAVLHRGSSLRDARYVDLFGAPGDYQTRHRVYGREGEPCPRCGGPVRRLSLGGRSTFLCETCQP
jgi:formamidopyrimidine-DNA glycosylase